MLQAGSSSFCLQLSDLLWTLDGARSLFQHPKEKCPCKKHTFSLKTFYSEHVMLQITFLAANNDT